MSTIRSILRIAILASAVVFTATPAFAQSSKQEAVARYKQGRALIESGKYEEALHELSASYDLLDSPNTLLLMAHAERELGHEVKAAGLYERVISEAKARISRGEHRFEKTVADATEWLDKLSTHLGKISVTVSGAPDGTTVRVDGKIVDVARTSDDSVKLDRTWWKSGTVQVQATTADGANRSMTAEIPPGGTASVSLDLGDVQKDEPSPSNEDALGVDTQDLEGKTIPTASWVTGGVGVVGLATFAIFGSMAKSKSADLDACAPRCPESERDVADVGKRDQTIANVGLAVGGIGLATAVGFYLFQSSPESEPEAGAVDVGFSPRGVLVRGSFD